MQELADTVLAYLDHEDACHFNLTGIDFFAVLYPRLLVRRSHVDLGAVKYPRAYVTANSFTMAIKAAREAARFGPDPGSPLGLRLIASGIQWRTASTPLPTLRKAYAGLGTRGSPVRLAEVLPAAGAGIEVLVLDGSALVGDIGALADGCPALRELSLADCACLTGYAFMLGDLGALKILNLSGCSGIDWGMFFLLLAQSPAAASLRSLHLAETNVVGTVAHLRNMRLECLDLSNCPGIDGGGFFNDLRGSALASSLKSLKVAGAKFGGQDVGEFARTFPGLTHLDLTRCCGLTGTLASLAPLLLVELRTNYGGTGGGGGERFVPFARSAADLAVALAGTALAGSLVTLSLGPGVVSAAECRGSLVLNFPRLETLELA
jgi:hypothetical protein